MSNKVDKLFKDKLESHSLQPSAQAWEKVEAHLGKKNKMVLSLRVAAAIALLGVLTFVGLNWNGRSEKVEIAKDEVTKGRGEERKSGRAEEVKKPEVIEQPIVKHEVKKKVQKPGKISNDQSPIANNQSPISNTQQPISNTQQVVVNDQEISTPHQAPSTEPAPSTEKGITLTYNLPPTKKGITLTYSLPPVNKDVAAADDVAVAEVAEPKKTGLERVLEIASEVKNGDYIGDLREAKDNILALDFKKDKNKKH